LNCPLVLLAVADGSSAPKRTTSGGVVTEGQNRERWLFKKEKVHAMWRAVHKSELR